MLGSKGSGKTHIASKFGKPIGTMKPQNFYEREEFIGNKFVKILIQDTTTTINGLQDTNLIFKS